MVTKIHVAAEKLKNDGYKIVVVGDPNHPEVKGTRLARPGRVVHRVGRRRREAAAREPRRVVVQSTWSGTGFHRYRPGALAKYYDVRAVNTICTDTHNRQGQVGDLAKEVQVMVIVGGKTSANTKAPRRWLAAMNGARAYHIEGPDELQASWFEGVESAGA